MTPGFCIETWVWHAAFSPNGQLLATVGDDRMVKIWFVARVAMGRPAYERLMHPSNVLAVAFHPNGRWLLTSSDDGTVRVWDLPPRLQPERRFHAGAVVQDVAWSSDGRLATAAADRTARIWDSETGKPLSPPLRHEQAVKCVEFSATGDRLVTAEAGGQVRLWESHTGHAIGLPFEHPRSIGIAPQR